MPERYDQADIQVLEPIDAVRRRPGMYIGDTQDGSGLEQLVWEVVGNAVDEHLAGHATWVRVTIDGDQLRVEDDGCGLPLGPAPNDGRPVLDTPFGAFVREDAQLLEDEYISASPRFRFDRRVDAMYWRLHVRFVGVAPNPHHWIRVAAGTEAFSSSGLANTVPDGNEGFWFDFDANLDDTFQFYTYWHAMRSGRCNDGSATPGCDGDQGTTYYYGNVFRPPADENRFERDTWTCLEIGGDVNAVGGSDGALRAWIDDVPVGEFAEGTPVGTWLRATFHPGGCEFSACTTPVPFEGFAFRTSDEVRFKEVFLDAYYERGSWENRRDRMREMGLEVGDESTIHYDDVVVATERIGCRR